MSCLPHLTGGGLGSRGVGELPRARGSGDREVRFWYLVRGAGAQVIEADWPTEEPPGQTVIVVEFPSIEAVKAWYASPEYAEAYTFRGAAVKRRMIFAAGTDE